MFASFLFVDLNTTGNNDNLHPLFRSQPFPTNTSRRNDLKMIRYLVNPICLYSNNPMLVLLQLVAREHFCWQLVESWTRTFAGDSNSLVGHSFRRKSRRRNGNHALVCETCLIVVALTDNSNPLA
jgi:hypothetical protein